MEVACADVLDGFCFLKPTRIIRKVRLHYLVHYLVHLVDDIREYGPLVGLTSERFESFNSVFNQAYIFFSNRLNPSGDIAKATAGYERIKHIIGGSYYFDDEEGYISPSCMVAELSLSSGLLRHNFSPENDNVIPGNVKLSGSPPDCQSLLDYHNVEHFPSLQEY